MNKYERHIGVVKFMVGDDEFSMRPSIDDWVKLFGIVEGKDKEKMGSMDADELLIMVDVITGAIKKCDAETSLADIKSFVESNLMVCMNAFTKLMNKEDGMTDLVKKRIDKLGKDNNPTTQG